MSVLRPQRLGLRPASAASSGYFVAELSYQRGDYPRALAMAERQLRREPTDIRAQNLRAASLAKLERFKEAEIGLEKLARVAKSGPYRERVLFNLGLVRLYQDLSLTGDCSVAKTAFAPPTASFRVHVTPAMPFSVAIDTWTKLLTRKGRNDNITRSYLSFAYLQFGRIDQALAQIILALKVSESYYVTNFVLGRIFLDLYMLGAEDNHFYLDKALIEFFEVEDNEIRDRKGALAAIYHEIYLDFALQAFAEARALNPYSVEVYLGHFNTYMLGGMFEEAHVALRQAESLAPDALPIIDAQFRLNELGLGNVDELRPLVDRLHRLKQKSDGYLGQYLIPSNYLI